MNSQWERRQLLKLAAILAASSQFPASAAASAGTNAITKVIPSTGKKLAVVGLGTSRTFTKPDNVDFQKQLLEVMRVFFAGGGQLVDSSPMYGPAEAIFGKLLAQLDNAQHLFAATKVWTTGKQNGIDQMNDSMRKMNVPVMDLMQIHNLKDWKVHLRTLREWKEQGKIRYLGITTSHGRSHQELLEIMRTEPLDFVQLSYNIEDRAAEEKLLPMAADKGIATLINRPYQRGSLFSRSKGAALPDIAAELGCDSWGQLYLKWILGHPAATCVIPATSKPHHVQDNMGAGFGRLPNQAERGEILKTFESL